jgi:glycosyltransferase involved in cell wall biosynthesis
VKKVNKSLIKFSLIIPAFNAEKYIKKCIDSVLNQTYNNYEIIVINDGSSDDTDNIIKEYKNIINIKKSNEGLSAARNDGVTYATGDYIIFLDSDDYINPNLLEELNNVLSDELVDVVRFQGNLVDTSYEIISKQSCPSFSLTTGDQAFLNIFKSNTLESSSLYAYKKEYFNKNNFKYAKGLLHEDFGLTILTILKAKSVISIPYIGHNYVQSDNSITRNSNYDKTLKRVGDMLIHYDYLVDSIKFLDNNTKVVVDSFLANSLINRMAILKFKDYKKYLKELKKRNIFDKLLDDTLIRKIKNTIIKFNLYLYIKIFIRR